MDISYHKMVDGESIAGVGTAQSSKLLMNDNYVSMQSTDNIYEEGTNHSHPLKHS